MTATTMTDSAITGPAAEAGGATSTRGRRSRAWLLYVGCGIVVGLVAITIGVRVAGLDPNSQDLKQVLSPASSRHWLGTDQLGRDILVRTLYAIGTDLRLAGASVAASLVIGGLLGAIAGYIGKYAEFVIMRLADIVSAIPLVVLVLALVFVLGQGERSMLIAITATAWVAYARLMRAEVLLVRDREYVLAAREGGVGRIRLLLRHILPNTFLQAVVFAMSDIVNIIMVIVFLGYLGVGVNPPTAEWGAMIADGQSLLQSNWGLATYPGLAVVVTALGFAFIADGLVQRWNR